MGPRLIDPTDPEWYETPPDLEGSTSRADWEALHADDEEDDDDA